MSEVGDAGVKQRVRQFYDRVGWQVVDGEHYQNARYEDLRPVSSEYIRRCHLRVKRFLQPYGEYLLDAGSGPVQYAEYLEYSAGYQYRVCVDISFVALQEAQRRLGGHALCVVADVANLPFRPEPFEGVVSLHTLHHLPIEEQAKAYGELYRVLKPGCSAVVVNGWTVSPLMKRAAPFIRLGERFTQKQASLPPDVEKKPVEVKAAGDPTGTFIKKQDAAWLKTQLGGQIKYEIYSWRSVSVRFLRALIHPKLGGRYALRLLFWLEDRFPRFFGENGQYPLVVVRKP